MSLNKYTNIFLDRDGVINEVIFRKDIVSSPRFIDEFKFREDFLSFAKNVDKTKKFFVVTNQPDIKRKLISLEEINLMHKKLYNSIKYDKLYFSIALNKNSFMRKPNPGMLIKAIKEFNINPRLSYMIGDRWSDIKAGRNIGCKTIFINRNYDEKKPILQDYSVNSFSSAARIVLNDKN